MNGPSIKDLRIRLGLTQKALAETVGVSPNTVARWERDELGISPAMNDRLLAVAESLPSGSAITRTSGIVLDPHHRAILERLNGTLDPEAFEKCAVNLLQANWPGLVPIRGGRDDGFDGAVVDGTSQEPFPLVVTTSARFIANLKASLDSANRAGWKPQRALFATSRRITPAKRRKLFEAARERGVELQTYDQDWFADRLYREPQWCQRLLGVTGRPHALSVFPVSRRPLLGDAVLGREQEMKWLLDPRGDCLLVGEPGSGKTFLLRALALEGKAFFLVDEDREQIANDLRSLRPGAVIVDDAHVRPDSIGNLVQLRCEVDADFRIIATCWPGESDRVRSDLQIGHSDMRTLGRIDADTMIEIIKSMGIGGPNELLHAIRSQAAGRPGLAATLAQLCFVGDVQDAVSGEGLVASIAPDLDRILGMESMRVLAPFALGGDAGARRDYVAERLGMSLLETSSTLAKLGAAGILRDRGDSAVSVEPPPMRWVLVRRAFFDGPDSLPVERFLPAVRNRMDSLETLIGARARGADVPNLERWLEEANSKRLWAAYASVGTETTRHALGRHPEIIEDLAEPALAHLPEKAIPMLLSRIADEFQADAVSESMLHPLKQLMRTGNSGESVLHPLEQWVKAGNSRDWDEALNRRRTLLRRTEAWWRQSRNAPVSIAAMCIALDSDFDFVTLDPGAGTHITFTQPTLEAGVIVPLRGSWSAVMTVVNESIDVPWINLLDMVAAWCRPRLRYEEEARDAANQFLSLMLNDLASASREYPGVQHRIAEFAKHAGVTVDTRPDAEFECLFPTDPFDAEDLEREHKRLAENARELAKRWRDRAADETAGFLRHHETEARRAGISYPRLASEFCWALAAEDTDPVATLRSFMHERLPADLVKPFLRKAIETDRSVWLTVSDCLDKELYVGMGVELVICDENAPREMVLSALAKAGEIPRLLEGCCSGGKASRSALSEMFRSPEASTALWAAIGHWQAVRHSRTEIPLDAAWRRAFLRSAEVGASSIDSYSYWIVDILKSDRELSVEWLTRFLDSDQSSFGYFAQEVAKKVIALLDSDQRIRILIAINPTRRSLGIPEIVRDLVENDPEIYRRLLAREELKLYHLSPLLGKPEGDWRRIAVQALDRGYLCEDVVKANLGGVRSWEGTESEMWAELRRHFEKFQGDDDSRIAEVGRLGARTVSEWEHQAKEREHEEAVYGFS